jgi:hypothetical protein
MNWLAITALYLPWLLLGLRFLESNLPVPAKLRRRPVPLERM